MVKIREASKSELSNILQLWNDAELIHKPLGRDRLENLQNQMNASNFCILLAEQNSLLIGSVMVTHDGRKGWINRLVVLKKFRNQGIAMALIKEAERWLSDQDIEIYAALIDDPNDPSMNLFSKAGYTKHTDIIYFTKKKYRDV